MNTCNLTHLEKQNFNMHLQLKKLTGFESFSICQSVKNSHCAHRMASSLGKAISANWWRWMELQNEIKVSLQNKEFCRLQNCLFDKATKPILKFTCLWCTHKLHNSGNILLPGKYAKMSGETSTFQASRKMLSQVFFPRKNDNDLLAGGI